MTSLRAICFSLMLMLGACAEAESDISITNAWVRTTVPGQKVAAAYMDLKSQDGATLIKAESNLAGTVEIHSMTMEQDVMKMRRMESLALPAGKTVSLAPGGYHLMLFDLKQPLDAGKTAEFKLHFATDTGETKIQSVSLPIRSRAD